MLLMLKITIEEGCLTCGTLNLIITIVLTSNEILNACVMFMALFWSFVFIKSQSNIIFCQSTFIKVLSVFLMVVKFILIYYQTGVTKYLFG